MPSRSVDLSPILRAPGESIRATGDILFDRLVIGGEEYVFKDPVTYDVTFTNATDGIIVEGVVSGAARVPCVRCLRPFTADLSGAVEAFFVSPEKAPSMPEGQDFDVLTSHEVHLVPLLEAALALQAPFAPVHSDDCKGICPQCGTDLNEESCQCGQEEGTSPFEVLRPLLEERDENADDG